MLDVRYMNKHDLLLPGQSGTMCWKVGDRPDGQIGWCFQGDMLILEYNANDEPITERIYLDKTPCNFGGERHWFQCPSCNRRVAILSLIEARFICRHCHNLPYGSSREGYLGRMRRKARKIRNRLGADMNLFEPVLYKPKGMHWSTFNMLVEKEAEVNQVTLEQMKKSLFGLGLEQQ